MEDKVLGAVNFFNITVNSLNQLLQLKIIFENLYFSHSWQYVCNYFPPNILNLLNHWFNI